MSQYASYADRPGQIIIEGQEITLKFQRTSDNTARISWNIPPPANGCTSDNQAYDGIVITVASKPANYLTTSPKDGTYYTGDPTGDPDLHAGDSIDSARVIGAFYHDKLTTFFDISDILPRTPYYVSGYAVDAVGRYHREGVHAYSVPTGPDSRDTTYSPAYHDIAIHSVNGITENTPTGLVPNLEYTFPIKIDCTRWDVKIGGMEAQTYKGLVAAINRAFHDMIPSHKSPIPPNAGTYYFDELNNRLYLWDGYVNAEQLLTVASSDPSQPSLGMYWYDEANDTLYIYEVGGWVEVTNIIKSTFVPSAPECGQLWFNGTDVWEWEGNHWCKLCVYVTERNPLLPPIMICNTFWYDSENFELFQWNVEFNKWDDANTVYFITDPNLLNTGDYWYDESVDKMKRFVGGEWNLLERTTYAEKVNNDHPTPLLVNPFDHWYIPSTKEFFIRNSSNTEWTSVVYISYNIDPLIRKSCDLWWNATLDTLNVWDDVNSDWLSVDTFYQTTINPTEPPDLPECAVWYNPVTGELQKILSKNCIRAEYILSTYDPTSPDIGSIWQDGTSFYVWDGSAWFPISPLESADDPMIVTVGEFWFNPSTMTVYRWDGNAWIVLEYSSIPLTPKVGTLWTNTVTNITYEWNGSTWLLAIPFASVELIFKTCAEDRDLLRFSTKREGCKANFEILIEANTLFTHLSNSVMYLKPTSGGNSVADTPMWRQLGVGTDGSPDERRRLHHVVRTMLGHTAVQAELTKEAIDICIDNALMMIRKHSNLSYKRAMFFLDLNPGQQVYTLANECVGFNKITYIQSIHRMRTGFLRNAFQNNDIFSQAAIQQLFSLGTFDMLTYHMSASYMEELETLFASRIMFQWVERTRELRLYQTPHGGRGNHGQDSVGKSRERVLVDATIERTEQDLLTDRETAMWIQRWTIAEGKLILSQIRGKYQTLPGPTGSTTLNSQELITQSESERAQLEQELSDLVMQDVADIGMRAHLVVG